MNESAGLLVFRRGARRLEVLLVHPGGPFWKNKDEAAWSIPKGVIEEGEEPLDTAIREFTEETSFHSTGPYLPLGSVRQKAGKLVHAWASEGDFDAKEMQSNYVKVVWPPGSGNWLSVPEVDRCDWFSLEEAARKLNPAQVVFLERLAAL